MENFSEFNMLETTPQKNRSSIISHAIDQYKKVIWYGLLILVIGAIGSSLISSILGSLVGVDQKAMQEAVMAAIQTKNYELINNIPGLRANYAVSFISSVLFLPLYSGFMYILNKANFQQKITLSDVFIGYKQNTLQFVLYTLILTFIMTIAFSLCFFPGLFIGPLLFLGLPIVFFENTNAIEALKKSYEIAKNNYWSIFGITIISFLISISGIIICGIGVVFTVMFCNAAMYSAYCAFLGAPKPLEEN